MHGDGYRIHKHYALRRRRDDQPCYSDSVEPRTRKGPPRTRKGPPRSARCWTARPNHPLWGLPRRSPKCRLLKLHVATFDQLSSRETDRSSELRCTVTDQIPDVYLPENLPANVRGAFAMLCGFVPDIQALDKPAHMVRLHLADGRRLEAVASQADIYALWCAPIGTLPGQTCEPDAYALTIDTSGRIFAVHIELPIFHHVVGAELITFDSPNPTPFAFGSYGMGKAGMRH